MPTRRSFLTGLAAAGFAAAPSWAQAGAPAYLSAARFADGGYCLVGLDAQGHALFDIPLPARGHAAAAHPHRPEAVGFARRPGSFALVIDCVTGQVRHRLDAPRGRHFYGHGAFSADGALLFTTENDYEAGQGVIGLWGVTQGYRRIGEFASGGVGPHDLRLLPDGAGLAVANGGIETHPDTGRAKLNIPLMRPNLSYFSLSGALLEQVEPAPEARRASIRHLAVHADGTLAYAMQWQGDSPAAPPLLGLHRRGGAPRLLAAPAARHRALVGYAGSVAFSSDGTQVAITSPRGGVLQIFDVAGGDYIATHEVADICGLAPGGAGFVFASGNGALGVATQEKPRILRMADCQWDNHLIAL